MSMFRKNDYILRQIEAIGRILQKIFDENRKTTNDIIDLIDEKKQISPPAIHKSALENYIKENNINEAENYLFSLLDSQKDLSILELSYWFYSELAEMPEEALDIANFSREEVLEGLNDALDYFPEVPRISLD